MQLDYTDRDIARFWRHVSKSDDCWLWSLSCTALGYGQFKIRHPGLMKMVKAHRTAWELTIGPIPDGLQVCHHCDVRHCCRPDHLFLGTALDNQRDKVAKGRQARGERHGRYRTGGFVNQHEPGWRRPPKAPVDRRI